MPGDAVALGATLALVDAARALDYSQEFLGYHLVRRLRSIRDNLAHSGFPQHPDDKLRQTLIPLLHDGARDEGVDWTIQAAPLGHFAPLFEIDVRAMTGGRGREELTAAEFAAYVAESKELHAEFTAARARMHNSEP